MEKREEDKSKPTVPDGGSTSRRDFLVGSAVGIGGTVAISGAFGSVQGEMEQDKDESLPSSEGYILVDKEMCAGCTACMAGCSLAHEGEINLSLSRMQVTRNPLESFPQDINQEQCRQCSYPACVEACPTDALHADEETGNVRLVDQEACVGCQRCIEACPYTPHRNQWNPESKSSQKCDLCADTPHWNEEGGPDGNQACVEACPMDAIAFSSKVPSQVGEDGYKVDLKPPEYGPSVWVDGKMS